MWNQDTHTLYTLRSFSKVGIRYKLSDRDLKNENKLRLHKSRQLIVKYDTHAVYPQWRQCPR